MQTAEESQLQSRILESLSNARRHRQWFASFAIPFLGNDPIEIGSGLGDYAAEWLAHTERFTVSECEHERYEFLRARFSNHPAITVRLLCLPTPETADHSAALAFNVLEHLPDDVDALRSMARLVKPGGAVVVVVPAFPFALSRIDVAVGHLRRYTHAGLAAAVAAAGLVVINIRYANSLGLVAYYLCTTVLRLPPRRGPLMWLYDRCLVPLVKALERRIAPPFGQSLVAIARVPIPAELPVSAKSPDGSDFGPAILELADSTTPHCARSIESSDRG